MKQKITVHSDVYVAHHGVGVATRITKRTYESLSHVYVLLNNGESGAFHPSIVYRAIATFAGWFYVDRHGRLSSVLPLMGTKTGRFSYMQPNLQNIPLK